MNHVHNTTIKWSTQTYFRFVIISKVIIHMFHLKICFLQKYAFLNGWCESYSVKLRVMHAKSNENVQFQYKVCHSNSSTRLFISGLKEVYYRGGLRENNTYEFWWLIFRNSFVQMYSQAWSYSCHKRNMVLQKYFLKNYFSPHISIVTTVIFVSVQVSCPSGVDYSLSRR